MSGAEVLVSLPRLENPHVSGLMAAHTNVVCQVWGKTGGIDNLCTDWRVCLPCLNTRAMHGPHMSGARTVTIFATNGHFGKGCVFELSIGPGHRVRPATVAEDAASHDRAVEAKIVELIPGRGSPTHRPGIERKRRLKEIPVFLDDPTQSIHSCPDDPFDRVGGPEALLPVGAGSPFALIKLSLQ